MQANFLEWISLFVKDKNVLSSSKQENQNPILHPNKGAASIYYKSHISNNKQIANMLKCNISKKHDYNKKTLHAGPIQLS